MSDGKIKKAVRESYATIVKEGCSCCSSSGSRTGTPETQKDFSEKIGYSQKELESVPEGSNLGLGCGNPVALASLREGETVLDLGSGAGFDCFLAAERVGKKGRVIGVDMTPEMIEKARENAKRGNYGNVEFRLGEIERLPASDNSVDAIISNCVINLAPDKKRVFKEAFRVLKRGGRLMVSDIVLYKRLPDVIKNSVKAYTGCIAGALMKEEYLKSIKDAGFREVKILAERAFDISCVDAYDPENDSIERISLPHEAGKELQSAGASVSVYAIKPSETP